MHQSVIRIGAAPLQAQQTSVIYKVATQSIPQDYPAPAPAPAPPMKSSPTVTTTMSNYPVMDATVASSVKGEPELNIGKIKLFAPKTSERKKKYLQKNRKKISGKFGPLSYECDLILNWSWTHECGGVSICMVHFNFPKIAQLFIVNNFYDRFFSVDYQHNHFHLTVWVRSRTHSNQSFVKEKLNIHSASQYRCDWHLKPKEIKPKIESHKRFAVDSMICKQSHNQSIDRSVFIVTNVWICHSIGFWFGQWNHLLYELTNISKWIHESMSINYALAQVYEKRMRAGGKWKNECWRVSEKENAFVT